MQLIARNRYLEWLLSWKDKHVIKVVSGVRRCGKSKLFEIYRDYLMQHGVTADQIIAINFEELEYEDLTSYRELYDYVNARLAPDKTTYVFLDEIQHVDHYEKAVDGLFIKDNVDVYITGSNAYFMSGELATLLSGRYIELKMLPLSFKEFCSAEGNAEKSRDMLFNEYITSGSFPFIAETQIDEQKAKEYVRSLYDTIIVRDVVDRLRVSDVSTLLNITKFLLHNIGSKVSHKKIADTLTSSGNKVDQKTVSKYIKGLTDSLTLYAAPRYNVKGRQLLSTNCKYYAVDLGLRNALVKTSDSDIGHILENVVYLELLRRGYDVYVGDIENGEIDFVAIKPDDTQYFQVSATTLEESTLKRELAPFAAVRDNYPKILLTLDTIFGTADYDGVKKHNVIDWLLE
ncbi:ATP-binding protein [Senegalimassilia anaerobia]|uniref:ATP-binding protein n=1 Tax=Senegalimassilia anaerobia TaxID=1473216 RepID=UPI00026D3082|nr:ATP-binding protein [Senegalimassilia anaerobia]